MNTTSTANTAATRCAVEALGNWKLSRLVRDTHTAAAVQGWLIAAEALSDHLADSNPTQHTNGVPRDFIWESFGSFEDAHEAGLSWRIEWEKKYLQLEEDLTDAKALVTRVCGYGF